MRDKKIFGARRETDQFCLIFDRSDYSIIMFIFIYGVSYILLPLVICRNIKGYEALCTWVEPFEQVVAL